MVSQHSGAHHTLVLLLAGLSLLHHHADGATVFGMPHLDYDTRIDTPLAQEGERGTWGDETPVGRGSSSSSSSIFPLSSRGQQREQQKEQEDSGFPYLPERYLLTPPEDHYLRELLLHSPAGENQQRVAVGVVPPPPPPLRPSSPILALPRPPPISSSRDLDQLGVSSLDLKEWTRPQMQPQHQQQPQLQLYLKKRLPQQAQHQPQQQWAQQRQSSGVKMAQKRWWGGRRRGQMDRRASQSKHYDCLKSCIKEGRLHPIQCHTLC